MFCSTFKKIFNLCKCNEVNFFIHNFGQKLAHNTQISVSFTARNDEEAKQNIEKILFGARENKECTPYVNSISKRNHENKSEKILTVKKIK